MISKSRNNEIASDTNNIAGKINSYNVIIGSTYGKSFPETYALKDKCSTGKLESPEVIAIVDSLKEWSPRFDQKSTFPFYENFFQYRVLLCCKYAMKAYTMGPSPNS